MTLKVKLLVILTALLALMAGARLAFRDVHDIRNAAVADKERHRAELEQAARERKELDALQAKTKAEVHGMGQSRRNFRWKSVLEDKPSQ